MTDRLSELQNQLTSLSQLFFTCVGVLQRDAPSIPLDANQINETQKKEIESFETSAKDMATQIAQTVKSINQLIESLPGVSSTEEQQIQSLRDLEAKNQEVGQELRQKVEQAELWLQQIREALRVISEDRFTESS